MRGLQASMHTVTRKGHVVNSQYGSSSGSTPGLAQTFNQLIFNIMKYNVLVTRITYGCTSLDIEADSPEEAKIYAEKLAESIEYTEYNEEYEYEID